MEEFLLFKPNKDKEHPRIVLYFNKNDEKHVIDMVIQMGLEVEIFIALVDELIEEHNLSAYFGPRECGCKMLDYHYLFYKFPHVKG
jgi:hypothetical protein